MEKREKVREEKRRVGEPREFEGVKETGEKEGELTRRSWEETERRRRGGGTLVKQDKVSEWRVQRMYSLSDLPI